MEGFSDTSSVLTLSAYAYQEALPLVLAGERKSFVPPVVQGGTWGDVNGNDFLLTASRVGKCPRPTAAPVRAGLVTTFYTYLEPTPKRPPRTYWAA